MKAEKIILGIVALGLLFKFLHWPGAGPILVVSVTSLAMLYLGGGFWFLQNKKEQQKRTALAVAAGILFAISCVGILFKLMYWPGAKAMLGLPLIGLPIILAIVFYVKGKADPKTEADNSLLIRVLAFSVVVIAFHFASNKDLLAIQYPNDPEVVRIKSNYFDHPENGAYEKEYKEYMETQRRKK